MKLATAAVVALCVLLVLLALAGAFLGVSLWSISVELKYLGARWGDAVVEPTPAPSGVLTSIAGGPVGAAERCDRALLCLDVAEALMKGARDRRPPMMPPGVGAYVIKDYPSHPALLCLFEDAENRRWAVYRGTLDRWELYQDDFTTSYASKHFQQAARKLIRAGVPTLISAPQETLDLGREEVRAHRGFLSLYRQTARDVEAFADPMVPLLIGGHSLGAGVAAVGAAVLASRGFAVRAFLCACPRPGDAGLATFLRKRTDCSTFANLEDAIPNSPPSVAPNFEVARGLLDSSTPPNVFGFAVQAGSFEGNHSIESYRLGIAATRAASP
jgi:hypothetical protein